MKFAAGEHKDAQVVVYPVFNETKVLPGVPDYELKEHYGDAGAATWFYGLRGQCHTLVVGLGKAEKFHIERIREAAGVAGRAINKEKLATVHVSFAVPQGIVAEGWNESAAVIAFVEGWMLGTYSFDRYKATQTANTVESLSLGSEICGEAIRLGRIRAEGTILARDLANEPPNRLRPQGLADRVEAHFAGTTVEVKRFEGEALERHEMTGLMAVGRGSVHPPVMLELYYCTDASLPLVALVGKGITFDTGGISLKRDHDISDMRMDMAGAAAVVGAFDILAKSGLKANVIGLIPAAENMPDGAALLPGEVLQYPNGVSVQVGNTDSEGRLVLADALIRAHWLGAKEVVDAATLTYSVNAALGSRYAGIWGDGDLVHTVRTVGEPIGERVWELPLVDEYEAYLKSDYADICNISHVGEAGATTAALFLRKFVHASLKWVHIDMASLKDSSSTRGYVVPGATGYGARLMADLVAARSNGQ